jgi:glutathione S-transferase
MSKISLYMAPGTCARVSCIALEEVGEPFDTIVVRFMTGEHKSADYRQLNPKGKVPTLVVDGETLTENVAILSYLNHLYPGAKLLPEPRNELERVRQLADLSFCASTLHPIVTRIRLPQFFAAKEAARSVWSMACRAMTEPFELIDGRLSGQPWWYGDDWSVMDGYLYWIFWRVSGAGFDVEPYANFREHAARVEARPAVQRALAREAAATAELETEGLGFTPPSID